MPSQFKAQIDIGLLNVLFNVFAILLFSCLVLLNLFVIHDKSNSLKGLTQRVFFDILMNVEGLL